jgi:hypothetical protein
MDIVKVVVAVLPLSSAINNVITEETAVVGVPEIVPVAASITKPAGRVPELTANVNGSAPPVTAISKVNAVPVVPERPIVGVVTTGFPVILSDTADVPVSIWPVFVPVALYLMKLPMSAEVVVYVSALAPAIVVQVVAAAVVHRSQT